MKRRKRRRKLSSRIAWCGGAALDLAGTLYVLAYLLG